MKILHVIPGMDPAMGGVVQAVATMIKSLFRSGTRNEVVCVDAPGALHLETYPFMIHTLGPGKGPWLYSPKLKSWLLLHMSAYDVVIVHGLWQYHSYAVNAAYRQLAKQNHSLPKVYVMPHGMLDPYFQKAKGRRIKAARNFLFWKAIENHVINEADGLLFTCEEERLLARKPFQPYHPRKESVVGLAVDEPPAFSAAMKNAFFTKSMNTLDERYFLILSRVHEKKGIDLMLEAYENMIRAKTSDNIEQINNGPIADIPKMIVAGPGLESKYGRALVEKVTGSHYLKNNVQFTGMLTGDEKWGAYYGCEAFILLSHQENFGISVVEAMACGKPVLISNKINIWREIKDSNGGLVEDDTEVGAEKILDAWLKLENEEKETIKGNARLGYERYFSTGPFEKRLLDVFQN